MCWANHRLDAPASSAARATSSISAVEENPSKNTPTDIIVSSFVEGFFALATDVRQRDRDEQRSGEQQEAEADRPRDEDRPVTVGQHHGAAKVLLQHRAEHEPEEKRSGPAVELAEGIADDAEHRHDDDIAGAGVEGISADAAQDQDGREQVGVGDSQQSDPDAD